MFHDLRDGTMLKDICNLKYQIKILYRFLFFMFLSSHVQSITTKHHAVCFPALILEYMALHPGVSCSLCIQNFRTPFVYVYIEVDLYLDFNTKKLYLKDVIDLI